MVPSLKEILKPTSSARRINVETVMILILFLILRLGTANTSSIIFPIIGIILLIGLINSNSVFGFIFVLYDMCALAEQVSTDSWQLGNIMRFSDLEFLILFMIGVQKGGLTYKGKYFNRLNKPFKFLFILVGFTIIYSSLFYEPYGAFRTVRVILYNSLIFIMPAYFIELDDLKKAFKYVFILICISTLISVGGFIVNNSQIITPFNKGLGESGRIWAEASQKYEKFRIYGGIGCSGMGVPFNFFSIIFFMALWFFDVRKGISVNAIFIIAIILEILALGRSSLGGILIALVTFLALSPRISKRANQILKLLLLGLALSIAVTVTSESYLVSKFTGRFSQLYQDIFERGEGTASMRFDYFRAANEVMDYSGGNIFTGLGYRTFPGHYGDIFNIGQFSLMEFQQSGQPIQTTSMDSGWANVYFTTGLVGIMFFIWFIVYYIKTSYKILISQKDILIKALSLTLFATFIIFPFMFMGVNLIYGKSIPFISQFILLIGFLGLWIDYTAKNKIGVK